MSILRFHIPHGGHIFLLCNFKLSAAQAWISFTPDEYFVISFKIYNHTKLVNKTGRCVKCN